MSREELLLRALCREVIDSGIQTDRFTKLWLALGLQLDGHELDMANKMIQRFDKFCENPEMISRMIH